MKLVDSYIAHRLGTEHRLHVRPGPDDPRGLWRGMILGALLSLPVWAVVVALGMAALSWGW